MVKTMWSKSVSWKSQKWILMWTYMRSVLNLAHFHILFSWLWSFILHLCELSLRAWRCSVSRLPHSLRTKALSCWRALTVFYGPSHLSQLQNYEIDARFFVFCFYFYFPNKKVETQNVWQTVPGHTAYKCQRWDFNPESKDRKTKTISKKTFSCYKRNSDRVLPCL